MGRRATVLGLAAAGASALFAVGIGLAAAPASAAPQEAALLAASGEPTPPDGTPGKPGRRMERLDRACDKIPALIERSEKLETRLAADAATKGSIAHLEARIAKAKEAGKTDLVALLEARLAVRKDLQQLLPERVEMLEKARTGLCVDVAKAVALR